MANIRMKIFFLFFSKTQNLLKKRTIFQITHKISTKTHRKNCQTRPNDTKNSNERENSLLPENSQTQLMERYRRQSNEFEDLPNNTLWHYLNRTDLEIHSLTFIDIITFIQKY